MSLICLPGFCRTWLPWREQMQMIPDGPTPAKSARTGNNPRSPLCQDGCFSEVVCLQRGPNPGPERWRGHRLVCSWGRHRPRLAVQSSAVQAASFQEFHIEFFRNILGSQRLMPQHQRIHAFRRTPRESCPRLVQRLSPERRVPRTGVIATSS